MTLIYVNFTLNAAIHVGRGYTDVTSISICIKPSFEVKFLEISSLVGSAKIYMCYGTTIYLYSVTSKNHVNVEKYRF